MKKIVLALALSSSALFVTASAQAATVTGTITVLRPDIFTVTSQFVSPQVIGAGTEFTGGISESVFGQTFGITADFSGSDLVFAFSSPNPNSNVTSTLGPAFSLDFASAGLFVGVGAATPVTCNATFGCSSQFAVNSTNDSLSVVVTGLFAGDSYRISLAGGVPEPATWAMLILGFGVIGMGMRRRARAELAFA